MALNCVVSTKIRDVFNNNTGNNTTNYKIRRLFIAACMTGTNDK